nr:hypothetical protein [uncultured Faecalimonas sp.]
MKWFGNRNCEGHEAETPDVKPKNQILQMPEKENPEAKDKLNMSERDKFLEGIKCKPNESSGDTLGKGKLDRANNGDSNNEGSDIGQRERERGRESQTER